VRQGSRILPCQDKALTDLGDCRTAALGGHRYRCAECDTSFWIYHACCNRACPACHGREMREWMEQRRLSTISRGRYAFRPPKDDSTTAFGPDSALLRVVEVPPRPENRRE
jgi:pyruvate-formate lyase-activating enzyme